MMSWFTCLSSCRPSCRSQDFKDFISLFFLFKMEFSLVFIFVTISVILLQMNLVISDLPGFGQDRTFSSGYVKPVPNDCTKYQVCDYSGCFVFNCGIGTEFNPRILVCDYPLRDRGACGVRDYNIGPTIPYPGRAIPSYPSYQEPTNNAYPGYNVPSGGYPGYPGNPGGSGYPGNPGGSGYPGNPGGSGYPRNPGTGGSNPAQPGCPAYCG